MPEKSTGFRPNLLVKILKSAGQTYQICHMYEIVSMKRIYLNFCYINMLSKDARTEKYMSILSCRCSVKTEYDYQTV